ncbi:MAG: T9SS type A sorting domain-containing protein [Cytophagaceae bacterium]
MKKFFSLIIIVFANINFSYSQNVSTVAGTGLAGSTNGSGAVASFNHPYGVALDSEGNIYVADTQNNKIRKITADGHVSTYAGSGVSGSNNGPALSASFNSPYGVVVDAEGNLYVTDSGNNKIRKIDPSGMVTTFAGSGAPGTEDGEGILATFNHPYGIAIDLSGNIYVTDYSGDKIRKITPAGTVTTFAGSGEQGSVNGEGNIASFNRPAGLAVDNFGNVYVADQVNQKVRKITSLGYVSTLAGNGNTGNNDGDAESASFAWPTGIGLDALGNVYVGDGTHKVRKISPSGVVSTFVGNGAYGNTDGPASFAQFKMAVSFATDATGNIFVADLYNHSIRKITPAITDLSSDSDDPFFNVFPVPVKDNLTICYQGSDFEVDIYNGKGSKVYSAFLNSGYCNIPFESMADGLYLVVLKIQGKVIEQRTITKK